MVKTAILFGMPTFAEKLTALMQDRSWSNEDLGRRLGVSDEMVRRWRAGKSEPRLSLLVKLADLLGVEIDYLARPESLAPNRSGTLTDEQKAILAAAGSMPFKTAMARLTMAHVLKLGPAPDLQDDYEKG